MSTPRKHVPHYKRRTLAQIEADDARLHEYLDAGGTPKGFAMDNGLTVEAAYRRARALGYRVFYLRENPFKKLCVKVVV